MSLARSRPVDARGAVGVQIGDGNTQIVYSYNRTWTDGIVPPPISDFRGSVASPYRGLASFEERDAAFFFGRERAATEILERMAVRLGTPEPLIVSGVSGAGKSSLLRAGVLHRLRGAGPPGAPGSRLWPCLLFAPGSHPLAELAIQLSASGGMDASQVLRRLQEDHANARELARQIATGTRLQQDHGDHDQTAPRIVIMIDQFEQAFTQCESASERQAFARAVAAMSWSDPGDGVPAPALVVIGVRADFDKDLAVVDSGVAYVSELSRAKTSAAGYRATLPGFSRDGLSAIAFVGGGNRIVGASQTPLVFWNLDQLSRISIDQPRNGNGELPGVYRAEGQRCTRRAARGIC